MHPPLSPFPVAEELLFQSLASPARGARITTNHWSRGVPEGGESKIPQGSVGDRSFGYLSGSRAVLGFNASARDGAWRGCLESGGEKKLRLLGELKPSNFQTPFPDLSELEP